MQPWQYPPVLGHLYKPWRLRSGPRTGIITHRVKPPEGSYRRIDFSGHEYMSQESFRVWVLLGMPGRADFDQKWPLTNDFLARLVRLSDRITLEPNLTTLRVTEAMTRRTVRR